MNLRPVIPSDIIHSQNSQRDRIYSDKIQKIDYGDCNSFKICKYDRTPILTVELQNESFPLRFSQRHGGLALIIYKLGSQVLGKDGWHALWHAFWRSLAIIFIFLGLRNLISENKAFFMSVLLGIDPIYLSSYFVFISEAFNLFSLALVFWLLTLKEKTLTEFMKLFFIIGLNLSIRPNFLWMIAWVGVFLNENDFKIIKQHWVKILLVFVFGLSPFFLGLSFTELLIEAKAVSSGWSPINLFENTFNIFFAPKSYLSHFIEWRSISHYELIFSCLIFLLLGITYYRNNSLNRLKINRVFLFLALSLFVQYVSTRTEYNHVLYLFYIIIPFYVALSYLEYFNVSKIIILLVFLRSIGFYHSYWFEADQLEIFDYNLLKKVSSSKILEGKSVVNVGFSDFGKLSYFNNKLNITNIEALSYEYENLNLPTKLILLGIDGVLVIPDRDQWSHWYKTDKKPFDYKDSTKSFNDYNIEIVNFERIEGNHGKGYNLLEYKIRE